MDTEAPPEPITLKTYRLTSICSDSMVRNETSSGREWVVVPVIPIVEGVLNGNLVLRDEIGVFPESWNGIPLPLGHPTDEAGDFVSAQSPEIIEKYSVGYFFNAYMEGSSLKGEMWIDVQKCESMGGDALVFLERVKAGKPTEVSTAYFCFDEEQSGQFHGQPYETISRDLRPDHLAVLLHEEGACNWNDGCGVPRINSNEIGVSDTIHADPVTYNQQAADCGCEEGVLIQNQQNEAVPEEPKNTHMEENMDRTELINMLAEYGGVDPSTLETLPDDALLSLYQNLVQPMEERPEAPAPEEEAPESQAEDEEDEHMNNDAPSEAQEVVDAQSDTSFDPVLGELIDFVNDIGGVDGLKTVITSFQSHSAEMQAREATTRGEFISRIMANSFNTFSREDLERMETPALSKLAAFADTTYTPQGGQEHIRPFPHTNGFGEDIAQPMSLLANRGKQRERAGGRNA